MIQLTELVLKRRINNDPYEAREVEILVNPRYITLVEPARGLVAGYEDYASRIHVRDARDRVVAGDVEQIRSLIERDRVEGVAP